MKERFEKEPINSVVIKCLNCDYSVNVPYVLRDVDGIEDAMDTAEIISELHENRTYHECIVSIPPRSNTP